MAIMKEYPKIFIFYSWIDDKKGLLYSEIFLTAHVPIEFKDRKFLWNNVELNEKVIKSQLARNFIILLQPSLSFEENKSSNTETDN